MQVDVLPQRPHLYLVLTHNLYLGICIHVYRIYYIHIACHKLLLRRRNKY